MAVLSLLELIAETQRTVFLELEVTQLVVIHVRIVETRIEEQVG